MFCEWKIFFVSRDGVLIEIDRDCNIESGACRPEAESADSSKQIGYFWARVGAVVLRVTHTYTRCGSATAQNKTGANIIRSQDSRSSQ